MRETIIVSSSMAWRSQRFQLAEEGKPGRSVMTVPQMAAHLAGGFLRAAEREDLLRAAREALAEGGFQEIGEIAGLPGMPGAVVETISRAWRAGLDLCYRAEDHPRVGDLALLERRIVASLPSGQLPPPALAAAGLAKAQYASRLFGAVSVRGVWHLDAVWQELFQAVASQTPVRWEAVRGVDVTPGWLEGSGITVSWREPLKPRTSAYSCATPRHEATEAMRWARGLISSGQARPEEVAIAAVSLEDWEDALRTFADDSNLPIHFVQGRKALSTFEGQQAASLATVLRHRATASNLRRLNALLKRNEDKITEVPADAAEAGRLLLTGRALQLWERALAEGPPEAVETNLAGLRTSDREEPAASIAIITAAELAGAPRRFVWLLGLNSRKWPRGLQEDRLLPGHIVPRELVNPLGNTAIDRLLYRRILATTSNECVSSYSRRGPDGRLQGVSPLIREKDATVLQRSRVPEHAFSESDRLLARAEEFAASEAARSADRCWTDWQSEEVTAHDGLVRAGHPVVLAALERIHSASSLRKLLRDPLGFVWSYCLRWTEPERDEEAMELDPVSFGTLVHSVLANAVRRLEGEPGGWMSAGQEAAQAAVRAAVEEEAELWLQSNPVPPRLLWMSTLADAGRDAEAGLTGDGSLGGYERCHAEVPFGDMKATEMEGLPWDPKVAVEIGSTGIRIGGRIDRVDLGAKRARVTDYKTGSVPKEPPVLNGGAELQRCLYAYAVKALLPDIDTVESRLLYLREEGGAFTLEQQEEVLGKLEGWLTAAKSLAAQGHCVAGPDSSDEYNRMRLALPAYAAKAYFDRKRESMQQHLEPLQALWEEK